MFADDSDDDDDTTSVDTKLDDVPTDDIDEELGPLQVDYLNTGPALVTIVNIKLPSPSCYYQWPYCKTIHPVSVVCALYPGLLNSFAKHLFQLINTAFRSGTEEALRKVERRTSRDGQVFEPEASPSVS